MKKVVALFLCGILAACATGSGGKKPAGKTAEKIERKAAKSPADKSKKSSANKPKKSSHRKEWLAETNPTPSVTLSQGESTLGETVLSISENVGGSLVLMNGIQELRVSPIAFHGEKFTSATETLAGMVSCSRQERPNYTFIYPKGYEQILDLSLEGKIDPSFKDKTAGMAFGCDTPLFQALALLGDAVGATIIADDMVAEARCGTLTLASIPVQDGLEALLKSARVPPNAVEIESTPEFIFIRSVHNTNSPSALLNPEALTDEQNVALDKKVDITLPAPSGDPNHVKMAMGAISLQKALGILSNSLGLPVTIEPGLEALPVNPCVMRQVRVRTAMDLIIRQWLQPDFGYSFNGVQITIERRK
jgi:hypothetical protein